MSAMLIPTATADALITFARAQGLVFTVPGDSGISADGEPVVMDPREQDAADAIGRVLLEQNGRSLTANASGPRSAYHKTAALAARRAEAYRFAEMPADSVSPLAIVAACSFTEYQIGDGPEYEMGLAQWLVRAVQMRAAYELAKLASGDALPWGIDTNPNRSDDPDAEESADDEQAPADGDAPATTRSSLAARLAAELSPEPEPDSASAHNLTLEEAVGPELAEQVRATQDGEPTGPKPEPELEAAKARKGAGDGKRKGKGAEAPESPATGATGAAGDDSTAAGPEGPPAAGDAPTGAEAPATGLYAIEGGGLRPIGEPEAEDKGLRPAKAKPRESAAARLARQAERQLAERPAEAPATDTATPGTPPPARRGRKGKARSA